jgi:hypothetical protein
MTKYLGIIAIIIGLISASCIETKISDTEFIISNYIEREFETNVGPLNYFKNLNKKHKDGDSTANYILQLHENIKLNEAYSTAHRKEIIDQLNEVDNHLANAPNIVLFKKLCKKLMLEHESRSEPTNYALIIENIENNKRDSLNLSITPIKYIQNDSTIKFYHKNKIVDQDELDNFKGNLNELEARITNSVTGELRTIRGQ